jgi:cytosine/adenosine deaminase-related metal-dependent hydrolase
LPLELHDYGDAVILPGLVNAHTHLELSHLRPPQNVASFTEWLARVMASPAPSTAESVLAGAGESVRFGVTVVGDISRDPVAARAALAQSPLRAVSYGEVVGMAGRREGLEARIAAAIGSPLDRSWRVGPGISPHAPYSVDDEGYLRCLVEARRYAMPLTTHLAESPDEAEFLASHSGPFRDLWDRIGGWDESKVPRFEGGPVRYSQSLHLLDYERALLAHVNYCDDAELDLLQRGRAGVVYCPRTHAYFGHPPHRWRDMLAAGINVCVGTDGRGSSPDLNLVEDLRLMHRDAPEVEPKALWEMATVGGARALDLLGGGPVMRTASGGSCVVFPVTTNDPLREILENNVSPLAVWAAGREVFRAAR